MTTPLDAAELARLCSLDLGKTVTEQDVKAYLLIGDIALTTRGFSKEEVGDIFATIAKEARL